MAAPSAAAAAPPGSAAQLVMTPMGVLRGHERDGVEQFLGIPYAAPPLGALRFAPPAPAPPWIGELDATRPGPVCLQPAALAATADLTSRENCLTLSIHRPAARASNEALPVLLWLHGGSFHSGAGSLYDPRRLVLAGDVLVVTINYRLGALGFLAHPELSGEAPDGLSGDYGLMDQQAALSWVKDNIAAFGGDRQRVTLQWQSAGGASVCAQLAHRRRLACLREPSSRAPAAPRRPSPSPKGKARSSRAQWAAASRAALPPVRAHYPLSSSWRPEPPPSLARSWAARCCRVRR